MFAAEPTRTSSQIAFRPESRLTILKAISTCVGRASPYLALCMGVVASAIATQSLAETAFDVPLMRAASHATQQGFVRVTAVEGGTIEISAWDDSGVRIATSLSVRAGQTSHFNSDDLEFGKAEKGIPNGIGSGHGDWYLQLRADFDFVATSYIRTDDGFLTTMGNMLVPTNGASFGAACVYEATIFNPASNTDQVSSLRIVERGGVDTAVSISGIDDEGSLHGPVEFEVPANNARTVTSQQLEAGDRDFDDGAMLGDGVGKWRLAIATDGAIVVMNLLQSPTGNLTNLGPVVLPSSSDAGETELEQGCDAAPPHRIVTRFLNPAG